MPQNKLTERKAQFHAWETYRDLGTGRSYSEVGRLLGYHYATVSKWAARFEWEKRLKEHTGVIEAKKERGDLLKYDDPVAKKMTDMMDKMEAIINSAFHKNLDGTYDPNVKINNMSELSKFVSEYRMFLEAYHKFVSEYMPAEHKKDRITSVKEFNVYMDNVSQEERIAMMKGLVHGAKPGRNKKSAGNVQDADYTEVPGQGNADGS